MPVNESSASAGHASVRLRAALALLVLVLLASGIGVYLFHSSGPSEPTASADARPQAGVGWAGTPRAVADLQFQDGDGKARSLSDFRGKVVLVNLWATWCAPCRKEMPALDRLQQMIGGPDFQVVALSIDSGGATVVRQFYDEIGIRALGIYVDPTMGATSKLRAPGIPTTLLLDREGRERWRKSGPAEWDSREIVESLRAKLRSGAP